MRILFVMRHQGYVRNFESTLAALAERGHDVHLGFNARIDGPEGAPTWEAVRDLAAAYPNLTHGPTPAAERGGWADLGRGLRDGLDWLRFLAPEFAEADKVRKRRERRAPAPVRRLAGTPLGRGRGLRALTGALSALERSLPVAPEVLAYVREQRPDLLLVTPLVDGGPQVAYVRAARRLGVRTGLCVSSWDNLTSKGLMHEVPDVVALWNAAQAREAVDLHGAPPERVVATGAQAYDHWFAWAPSTSREGFLRPLGLDPDKPVLLYLCSSGFIAGREVEHVERWLTALRAHPDPDVAGLGVLVRPHPANGRQWQGADLARFGNAALWRHEGTEPATRRGKEEFFDSIHHAAAVVGLNTSALIESAIVGRPVLTLLTPEYERSQRGMPHFGLIAESDAGVLSVASSFEEHVAHIREALAGDGFEARRARFLAAFVRPHGLEVAATETLVDALEAVMARPTPAPRGAPAYAPVLRAVASPLLVPGLVPGPRERRRLRRRAERRLGRSRKHVARRVRRTRRAVERELAR